MSTAAMAGQEPWYRSLDANQWKTMIASNIGWMFDGYETYALIITVGVALHHFDGRDLKFVAARRALVSVNFSCDDHARFLRQPAQRFKRRRLILQRHHALNRSGAVAENREKKFPRLAQVVQPPAEGNFLPVIFSNGLNGNDRQEY